MLNLFQAGQTESMSEITNDLFASFDELGGSGMSDTITYTGADGKPVSTSVSNALKSTTEKGISTKAIEKSIKTSFLLDYPSLYSVQNSVTLRDNVLAGGRWVDIYTDADKQANLKAKADSSIDKINLKDTVNIGNDALKGVLISFNDRLEKAVDDKIVKERYDMDIVIPTTYEHRENSKISKGVRPLKRTAENNFTTSYEIFYFGKSANLINNAQELSIYRGSFRNLSSLTGINYTTNGINYATLASDENPSKTPQESTNLQLKSVGASYDLFSTQVEANRGYNLQNTQTEYDSYEENKTYAKRGTECKKRTINIRGWKRFCRQMEHKADENGGYETLSDFAQRRRGGASPLNLDFDLLTNL
ncbi:MAG: hypothetical protein LBG52_03485 [Candidatus Peribacteria bacterium]|jgi:hypothetical protein|nr:hypothetical protein [Candidatus Peribacteria bacterium]